MRELTEWLVQRHTDFGTLDNYFDGYSIAGERLAPLAVPTDILMSADDPVIPIDDFHELALPATARLAIARWGGHCAFIQNVRLDGFVERWVAERLRSEEHTSELKSLMRTPSLPSFSRHDAPPI